MPARAPEMIAASRFDEIVAQPPEFARLQAQYDTIADRLENAQTADEGVRAFEDWDVLRRGFATWAALAELQFQRDTGDAQYKAGVELLNELRPKIEGLDVAMKRRFLGSPWRDQLEAALGAYLFARWETDVTAYDPVVEPFAVEESTLQDEYTALVAAAQIPFRGETLNLSLLGRYLEDPDRETRREATLAKWRFFEERSGEIDRIFDGLVRVRDRMARDLDFRNFTELAYRRLARTDYGAAEVARWREEIQREIVPLADRIVKRQARDLGIERVMLWDEKVFAKAGTPRPPQQYAAMVAAGRESYNALGPELGSFAGMMFDRDLVDLQSRKNKASAGFCTSFPEYGLPYVFANFNGTTHDVNVLVHEFGHAFQTYSSRNQPALEYLWPTYEACEIHSMSMEFFMWPQLERFFGEKAQQYRIEHLMSTIAVLPYAAAVDHFQHLVYEHPEAGPQERHAFWRQVEAAYMPWRRYDGIAHLERGAFWHQQRHIFIVPFYYIDYTLAACCALQFWIRSLDDYEGALAEYKQLCARGGTLPFQSLVRSAGLKSPFEAGVLRDAAERAAEMIGV